MSHRSLDIANYFIRLGQRDGVGLTPMQLQKLIYFAHGWHLSLVGKPLVAERFQAWDHGPVLPRVYHEFKFYGHLPIVCLAGHDDDGFSDLDPEFEPGERSASIIRRIWDLYGEKPGAKLSRLTHKAGTPWDQVREEYGGRIPRGEPIPNDKIRAYYDSVRQRNES